MRYGCRKMFLRDLLVYSADFVGMTLLAFLFLLPLVNSFLRVCLPTLFAAVLSFFLPPTTSAMSGTANFNKSAPRFLQLGRYFYAKRTCGSPNIMWKCTESPSMLSANYSVEWNLYLSWSNHFVTSFRLKMNVEGFSKHQNMQVIPTDARVSVSPLTVCVSQVKVKTMKIFFEQWSELQVGKGLIVDVLSSSYNVYSFDLWNETKATQQWSLCFANDFVLNRVRVYRERVYADNFVSKFWLVRYYFSQHHSKFHANIVSKIVFQVCTKECKTRSFICKVNMFSQSSLRHFNCDTAFVVIVYSLNEIVHDFNNIRNGRVVTRFQKVKTRQNLKVFPTKKKIALCDFLVHWWVRCFQNCNLPLIYQILLLR